MLTLLGMFPHNALSTFAVIIGSALEVLLLSLGLANRINSGISARNLQATNFARNIAAIAEQTSAQMNDITMELTATAGR